VETLLLPLFLLVGFMGGSFLVTRLTHWGLLVWVSLTKHGGDFLGAPRRRLLWVFPFVALLHPTPYFLVVVVLALYRMLQAKVGAPLLCVLLGLALYLAVTGLTALKVLRLRRPRGLSTPRT
jgi:hypothetical protein